MKPPLLASALLLAAFGITGSAAMEQPSAHERGVWLPPVEGPLRVSRHFEMSDGPYGAGHRGIDLPATPGASVRSPAAGTVSFAGIVVDRPVLSIRVGERTVLSLEPVESALTVGERVARGQPLGTVSKGGHCAEGCLHLGVRADGKYVNPLRYLRSRPVLLPW